MIAHEHDESLVYCEPVEVATDPESARRLFMRHALEGAEASAVVVVLLCGLALALGVLS